MACGFGTQVVPLALFVVVFAAPLATAIQAQSASEADTSLPWIGGRVTGESGEEPVVCAKVEPYPAFRSKATTTNEQGEFAALGRPSFSYSTATNPAPYDLVQYFTITAPGHARTIVDPCADGPWAAPIRMRDCATLRGRVDLLPPGPGHHVVVLVSWEDLCWPPRTGLTRTDERWIGDLDADGRFEISDLPAQVPLAIRFDAGTTAGRGAGLADDLVLAPGEVRELAFHAPDSALDSAADNKAAEGPWIPVAPSASVPEGATENLIAFELAENWRFLRHRNGGGRWHMHGSRACNDLEALPGVHTLIAFDARGHIGLERFDIQASDVRLVPHATTAPGALLRIAFDGPEERARIVLSSQGIEFRARDLPRGAVWYELAPAGKVTLRVTSTVAEPRSLEAEAHAGCIERVEL